MPSNSRGIACRGFDWKCQGFYVVRVDIFAFSERKSLVDVELVNLIHDNAKALSIDKPFKVMDDIVKD